MNSIKEVGAVSLALLAATSVVITVARGQGNDGRAHCMSRTKAVSRAIALYMQDHEDRFPPSAYRPMLGPGGDCSDNVLWPQVVLPFHGNWSNYRCPLDPNATDANLSIHPCTGVMATTVAERDFAWAARANRGYNYQFLSPMLDRQHSSPTAYPLVLCRVNDPASTLMLVDSIWDVDSQGRPAGGGFAIADPPSIYPLGNPAYRQLEWPLGTTKYYWLNGWNPNQSPVRGNQYGKAWPWHAEKHVGGTSSLPSGKVVSAMVDGHVQALTLERLAAGCDLRAGMGGRITDPALYLWDIQE